MIRTLLFATVWSHVFSLGAVLVLGLAGPLLRAKPAQTEPAQQAIEASARMSFGIPGAAGFLGAGLGLLGLLPGTTSRKKVFRPSARPLMRQIDPALFILRQLLDGSPFPSVPASLEAARSDLPRISLLTVGIISILLAITGVLCSLVTLFSTPIPADIANVVVFRLALYATSCLCLALCGWLLVCGFEFVQTITRKARRFSYFMMLQMFCLALAGSLTRVLCWLVPEIGTSAGAGIEAAKSGFMVQMVVLFPLWAPFLALYAMSQLDAQRAAAKSGAAARPAADKAQLLKALQDKYQAVRRMYDGFNYIALVEASPAKQRAGMFAAMKFIRSQADGESRYIQALTELSRAFDQAMPAYEAIVLHAEVTFFQAVRASMLKSMSLTTSLAVPVVEAPESAAVEIREFLPTEEDEQTVPRGIGRQYAAPASDPDDMPEAELLEPATFLAPTDDAFDFYDVLDADDPQVEALGEPRLQQIGDELTAAIRRHVTADWTVRKNAKGEMRLMVKKILKKHGYPSNRHETVVQAVLQQAEAFCLELGGLAP